MTSPPDPVFNVHAHEHQRVELEERRLRLEAQAQAARTIRVIENAPGWKEFVVAVGQNRDVAVASALDERCPNRDYWSGVAFGYSSILTIADNVKRFELSNERALKTVQDSLKHYNEEGRALPTGIGGSDARQ